MALARREVLILGAIGAGAAVAGGWSARSRCRPKVGGGSAGGPVSRPFRRQAHFAGVAGPCRRVQLLGNLVCSVREEIPMLVAVREVFAAKGAEIVGIASIRRLKSMKFAKTYRITYPC